MIRKYIKTNLRFALTLSFFILVFAFSIYSALAATNIHLTDKWAWNDVRGWLDFNSPGTANLNATKMTGYGVFNDNSDDYISLDCVTSPGGGVCGTDSYFVSHDGFGDLAGWAWNDGVGWISFCGNSSGGSTWTGSTWACPTSPTYQVVIDASSGNFSGWAWNDTIGWISFCGGSGTTNCPGATQYRVNTTYFGTSSADASGYLISNTFDTGVEGGASFNSIIWQGTVNGTGNHVNFQLATSDCPNGATDAPACATGGWGIGISGDGAYAGIGGDSNDYYSGPPGASIPLIANFHNNKRYYRYKMYIEKASGNSSPVVQDVIINWSP